MSRANPITFRPARADELQTAQALVIRSINDLTERHGFGTMATLRPPDFQLFSLKDDPDGVWVAEADGEILGFAFSWASGDLWFLAELFVAPGHQGRGIGNELLTRTLEHARKSGAGTKALITFTFNTVSQGLYIRHGLFPRLPIYFFRGGHDVLIARRQGGELRYADIENTASHRETLSRLDASTLGSSRDKHHGFLLADGATRGVLLYAADDCVGYAYVSSSGHIGPLAVAQPHDMGAAFRTALKLAAETGTSHVSAFLPGVNDAALGIAVAHGMRITFPMVLLSSRDFGDWARYVPRNPGFM
jgi:ribosomal protein S18 acetylase RimI-like enzyme